MCNRLSGWPLPRSPNYKLHSCSGTGINSKIGRIIIGRKLYRQGITPSSGNWSTLIQKPFSGCSGLGDLHRASWEPDTLSEIIGRGEDAWNLTGIKGNLGNALNPFRLKPPGKRFQDTVFHSRSTLLFLVASYSTWEDPSPSQKKHLWSVSLRTGNC